MVDLPARRGLKNHQSKLLKKFKLSKSLLSRKFQSTIESNTQRLSVVMDNVNLYHIPTDMDVLEERDK
jgi:hypothetical protein